MAEAIGALSQEAYLFDEFRLDIRRGILQRNDGADLSLRPHTYELLLHLLRHPNELLAREALLEGLWPEVAVTDDSLTQCVSELRRALGDRGPALLRTVPRRGYMLTGDVRRDQASVLPETQPRASARVPEVMLTRDVLVFESIELATDERGAPALAQALAAEMLSLFTSSELNRVLIHPTSSPTGAFRLTGALLRAGEDPLLSLLLEDVDTGRVLWAEQVTLPPPERRRQIMLHLVGHVGVHISSEALHRARRKSPGELGAHDLVTLGRELHHRGGQANTLAAQRHFLRAIELAPDLAPAHGYHVLTMLRHITHGWGDQDSSVQLGLALANARRAVEMEPRSAICLAALAFALLHEGKWDEAIKQARMAVGLSALSAIDTRTVCGEVLAAAGEADEAVACLEGAIALDPFSPARARAVFGRALLMAGRTEVALAELHHAAAIMPDYAPCLRSIVVAAVELGRIDEALRAFAALQRLQRNWLTSQAKFLTFFRHQRDLERFLAAFACCTKHATPAIRGA